MQSQITSSVGSQSVHKALESTSYVHCIPPGHFVLFSAVLCSNVKQCTTIQCGHFSPIVLFCRVLYYTVLVFIRIPYETQPPPNPTPNLISSSRLVFAYPGNPGLCPQLSAEPQGTRMHAATSSTVSSSSLCLIPAPTQPLLQLRQTLLVRDILSSCSELAAQDCPIQEAHPSPPAALCA